MKDEEPVLLYTYIWQSFFPRTIPQWNQLNQDIMGSPSLDVFRNRLP